MLVRIELWVLCPFQNVERATCKEIEATGIKVWRSSSASAAATGSWSEWHSSWCYCVTVSVTAEMHCDPHTRPSTTACSSLAPRQRHEKYNDSRYKQQLLKFETIYLSILIFYILSVSCIMKASKRYSRRQIQYDNNKLIFNMVKIIHCTNINALCEFAEMSTGMQSTSFHYLMRYRQRQHQSHRHRQLDHTACLTMFWLASIPCKVGSSTVYWYAY